MVWVELSCGRAEANAVPSFVTLLCNVGKILSSCKSCYLHLLRFSYGLHHSRMCPHGPRWWHCPIHLPCGSRQLLLDTCHNNRNPALFLMGMKGVEKVTILRNAASGSVGFQDIAHPVRNVFVCVCICKRESIRDSLSTSTIRSCGRLLAS